MKGPWREVEAWYHVTGSDSQERLLVTLKPSCKDPSILKITASWVTEPGQQQLWSIAGLANETKMCMADPEKYDFPKCHGGRTGGTDHIGTGMKLETITIFLQ